MQFPNLSIFILVSMVIVKIYSDPTANGSTNIDASSLEFLSQGRNSLPPGARAVADPGDVINTGTVDNQMIYNVDRPSFTGKPINESAGGEGGTDGRMVDGTTGPPGSPGGQSTTLIPPEFGKSGGPSTYHPSEGGSSPPGSHGGSPGTTQQPGGYPSQPGQQQPGGYPSQPGQPQPGGYPSQPGQPQPGGYPTQPGQQPGGYPSQPGQQQPGGHPSQPGQPGGYPSQPGQPQPGGYPSQPGQPQPGGYPPQPGQQPGGYPSQPGQPQPGGYPTQPGQPQPGGYPSQPGQQPGGYPSQPGQPQPGGYPSQPGQPQPGGYPSSGQEGFDYGLKTVNATGMTGGIVNAGELDKQVIVNIENKLVPQFNLHFDPKGNLVGFKTCCKDGDLNCDDNAEEDVVLGKSGISSSTSSTSRGTSGTTRRPSHRRPTSPYSTRDPGTYTTTKHYKKPSKTYVTKAPEKAKKAVLEECYKQCEAKYLTCKAK